MKIAASRISTAQWLSGLLCLLVSHIAIADELRPAYLGLEEQSSDRFSVVWKLPVKNGMIADVMPVFPESCDLEMHPFAELTGDARIVRGQLSCRDAGQGLAEIKVPGLKGSLTDTLVHIAWADGETRHHTLKPGEVLSLEKTEPPLVNDYFVLGFEHILGGTDHLLFVLALLLIVTGSMAIFKAITAFTVGHSITLALASLGLVSLSPAPVEALIALSIAFLCVEAVHMRRGRQSLTTRVPWIVAILFGLLHGLGFAGALKEVGLPQGDLPLALLFFNLGIEAGQLAFVAVVIGTFAVARQVFSIFAPKIAEEDLSRAAFIPAYVVGVVGLYWAIERTVQIVT